MTKLIGLLMVFLLGAGVATALTLDVITTKTLLLIVGGSVVGFVVGFCTAVSGLSGMIRW